MGKIELKICMGTMCYVMGGAELKAAIDSCRTKKGNKSKSVTLRAWGCATTAGNRPTYRSTAAR